MKRKYMLLVVLLMVVGFATVSTTLFINGSTNIIGKKDDFKVYYSDAKVNGVQDLSIVESETSLRFSTELDTLGETYVIEYDVTNSSKNYDADLEMVCTGGDEYLSVVNSFDDVTNLAATETRVGTLTLTLNKTYVGDAYDVDIECTITANAVERTSLGTGTPASPVSPSTSSVRYKVGDEIVINEESFNVVSQTDSTISLLTAQNLGENYKQSDEHNYVEFNVDDSGWTYTPGPQEIELSVWSPNISTYINNYVSYLQTELDDTNITGTLITLTELGDLGCDRIADYDYYNSDYATCLNSDHLDWLNNGYYWWTRSAESTYGWDIWTYTADDELSVDSYDYDNGVRPVITISKSTLGKYLNLTIE